MPFECCVLNDGELDKANVKDLATCRKAAEKDELEMTDANFLHAEVRAFYNC